MTEKVQPIVLYMVCGNIVTGMQTITFAARAEGPGLYLCSEVPKSKIAGNLDIVQPKLPLRSLTTGSSSMSLRSVFYARTLIRAPASDEISRISFPRRSIDHVISHAALVLHH